MKLTTFADEARLAFANLTDRAASLATPSVRLGVTGLSRAGKTVFIAALAHNLIHGGRLPLFRAYATGRIKNAELEPQPDDDVPRFDYEAHIAALIDTRVWPESTRRISELRLTIDFESASYLARRLGRGRLHVDIVDYPGEWLLDLPLLSRDFTTWSADAVALARSPARADNAAPWLARLANLPPGTHDETTARELAALFTDYLRRTRADATTLSTLSPGRFLMPGDLDGSPALTFSPLLDTNAALARIMSRRFEAYKTAVVKPFFRDHFARLDRQVILVDALHALNGGPNALGDLRAALTDILAAYRPGRTNWLTSILTRRIDRVLVAATKADHLHHADHDRLEAILGHLLSDATARAEIAGAEVKVLAIAAVRATREADLRHRNETLPAILGTPLPGERMNGQTYDGKTEIALFPGDLPNDPAALFQPAENTARRDDPLALQFIRFRPPPLERTAEGLKLSLPHIRLDRALDFLIGDYLA